jgi:hypothetical protein
MQPGTINALAPSQSPSRDPEKLRSTYTVPLNLTNRNSARSQQIPTAMKLATAFLTLSSLAAAVNFPATTTADVAQPGQWASLSNYTITNSTDLNHGAMLSAVNTDTSPNPPELTGQLISKKDHHANGHFEQRQHNEGSHEEGDLIQPDALGVRPIRWKPIVPGSPVKSAGAGGLATLSRKMVGMGLGVGVGFVILA